MKMINEIKQNLAATIKQDHAQIISDLQSQVAELKECFILMSETLKVPEPTSVEDIKDLMAQKKALKALAMKEKEREQLNDSLARYIADRTTYGNEEKLILVKRKLAVL